MKAKTLPKLHLACDTDELRSALTHILITKEEIVATDAHILVIHKTKEFFDEESIKNMPERFLIHREQWKRICIKHIAIKFENNEIQVIYDGYINSFKIKFENNYDQKKQMGYYLGKFPAYKNVLLPDSDIKAVENIGIDPDLITKLKSAMFFPYEEVKIMKFTFYGPDRHIIVTPTSHCESKVKALIMPVMIPDEES